MKKFLMTLFVIATISVIAILGTTSASATATTESGITIQSMEIISMPYTTTFIKGYDADADSISYWGLELLVTWSDNSQTIWSYSGSYNTNIDGTPVSFDETDFEESGAVILTCGDASVTIPFNVIENPIASIEIEDVSIIEGSGIDENGQHHYYVWPETVKCKITFKDGTTKYSVEVAIEDSWYWLDIDTSGQEKEAWLVGNTYAVVGEILGVSDTFNVTIVPSPVESIEIQDVYILEGDGEYYDGEYRYYLYSWDISCKITFKDGTVRYATNFEYYGRSYSVSDISNEEPWLPGNTYTATAMLTGVSDTFNVTIVPTPVESVAFEDIVLYVGIDTNYGNYYISPILREVLLKNGELANIVSDNTIEYNGDEYYARCNAWDMQYEEEWMVGNTYTVTGTLLGVSGTFNVTIAESPVNSLEIIKAPQKTEYLVGENVDLNGAIIRVHYNDGSYEDINVNETFTNNYRRQFYFNKVGRYLYINFAPGKLMTAGTQSIEIEFAGKTCEFVVEVNENKAESISIKENADKSITITVHNTDGSSYDMQLLDFSYCWYGDDGEYYVGVLTDYGEFDGIVYASQIGFSLALELNDGGTYIQSNVLPSCELFNVWKFLWGSLTEKVYFSYGNFISAIDKFDGEINEENIDSVIYLAGYITPLWNDDEKIIGAGDDGLMYSVFKGSDVKDAMLKSLILKDNDIDLTLSSYYDASTDTYKFYEAAMGGGEFVKWCPDKLIYTGDGWSYETALDDGTVIRIEIDNAKKVRSISRQVNEKNITSITITTEPDKVTYIEGESFDLSGMIIEANYNNNTSAVITDYTISGYDSTPGTKTITVSYGNFTTSFTVEVIQKNVTGIEIVTKPDNMVYFEHESLDRTGMIVVAYYDDGTSKILSDYSVSCGTSVLGKKTVTIAYRGKTASFEITIKYKIEFRDLRDFEETVLSSRIYFYGDSIDVPEIDSTYTDNKYQYTFEGWMDMTGSTTVFTPYCEGNQIYWASYTRAYIPYTVVFENWDGSILLTQTYHYGDTIYVPANPTRTADNTYTYAFIGWDKEVEKNCNGDATYQATYQPKYIEYSVEFADEDGKIISRTNYHYGNLVVEPEPPHKLSDENYYYLFAGWDREVVNCNGNAIYHATYTAHTLPQVTVNDTSAKAGETIIVDITLSGAPNLETLAVSNIVYDTSVFELVNVEWKVAGADLSSWDSATGKGAVAYSSAVDLNGIIITLTFKVNDSAIDGSYNVSCVVDSHECDFKNISGDITIYSVLTGDIDGNEKIDKDDAIYILMSTFFPEDYPLNQDCDFDGNNKVDKDDAIYVLMYTFFPEDYPLTAQPNTVYALVPNAKRDEE